MLWELRYTLRSSSSISSSIAQIHWAHVSLGVAVSGGVGRVLSMLGVVIMVVELEGSALAAQAVVVPLFKLGMVFLGQFLAM